MGPHLYLIYLFKMLIFYSFLYVYQRVITIWLSNIAMENPNHRWRFLAGKIIYFYGPWLPWQTVSHNQRVRVFSNWIGLSKFSQTRGDFLPSKSRVLNLAADFPIECLGMNLLIYVYIYIYICIYIYMYIYINIYTPPGKHTKNYGTSPFYSWENSLFRLGHFQ